MNGNNTVTHPDIANDIADYIGATAEERDSIVAKPHRGKWKPGKKAGHTATTRSLGKMRGGMNSKPVVAIDKTGAELARFPSAMSAAASMLCSNSYVGSRCDRTFTAADEFGTFSFTFRFLHDWDAMTPEERIADLKNPKARYKS